MVMATCAWDKEVALFKQAASVTFLFGLVTDTLSGDTQSVVRPIALFFCIRH